MWLYENRVALWGTDFLTNASAFNLVKIGILKYGEHRNITICYDMINFLIHIIYQVNLRASFQAVKEYQH